MSMQSILRATEWKPQATTGNHSQVGLALLGEVAQPHLMTEVTLTKATFNGCLNESARVSGKEDLLIADEIHISPGYMSRFMRGVAQQWAKRLVLFMLSTNSRAPPQWIAYQVGCEVVLRSSKEAQIRELERQLAEAKGLA